MSNCPAALGPDVLHSHPCSPVWSPLPVFPPRARIARAPVVNSPQGIHDRGANSVGAVRPHGRHLLRSPGK
eukprot:9498035-Alexandrium_andersonii.AAC.1